VPNLKPLKPHTRINDILLGPLERPALAWLAAHLPNRVSPDILTFIGFLGAVVIFFSYLFSRSNPIFFWIASLGLVINWFGDSLDGTVARYRHIERPKYGFFIDHTIDALNETLIVLGLGLSPYVRFDVACLVLIAYLLMSNLTFIRTYIQGEFQLSYSKLGPTEVRVLLILLNIGMYFAGPLTFSLARFEVSVYDLIVCLVSLLLLWFYLSTTYQQAKILRQAESRRAAQALEIEAAQE